MTAQALGLAAPPDTGNNGVHASASPFEGLAERLNWMKATITDDAFGKKMLDAGISEETIKKWSHGCLKLASLCSKEYLRTILLKTASEDRWGLSHLGGALEKLVEEQAQAFEKQGFTVLGFRGRGGGVLNPNIL